MKNVFLLSLIMAVSQCCLAQEWGEWINVGHQIQVSFKFSNRGCNGTSKARIRNSSEGTTFCMVTINFSKVCNGADAGKASVSAYKIGPGQISESSGDWYNTERANNIQLTKLTDVECKDLLGQSNNRTNSNGVSHGNGTSEIYYPKAKDDAKEKEEELKKQQQRQQQEATEKYRREQLEKQRAAQQEANRKLEEIKRNSEKQRQNTNDALHNFNKDIDDITNSVVNDMQRKQEEEKRRREEEQSTRQSNSAVSAGRSIESLSSDRSGASANDGYFTVNSYSDVLRFILIHGKGGNSQGVVDAEKTSIDENGVLKLVYTFPNYRNQYYEYLINLKRISLPSIIIGSSGGEIAVYFEGDNVVQNKYYKNGKVRSDLLSDKGHFNLDGELFFNENKQYILRDFLESLKRIVSGKSAEKVLRTLYPSNLSASRVNRDQSDKFFNIRTIAGLAYFIQKQGNYDADKTTCTEEGFLSLVAKGSYFEHSTYTNDFIVLKKIDTASFIIKETTDALWLEFSGSEGVFSTTLNEFDPELFKRTGLWNYKNLKRANSGAIKLNKDLLNDNKQYLLLDFIVKLKYYISTL